MRTLTRGARARAGAFAAVLAVSATAGTGSAAQADPITDALAGLISPSTVDALGRAGGWIVDPGETTMSHVAAAVGAQGMYASGYDGRGVGVALIDTGAVPVAGLTAGNVRNGADLSFESQSAQHRYLDTFGHGTHLAGIIAGNDPLTFSTADLTRFQGVAPGARLTSLKLGTRQGAVDVSQVVAAIDWVVAHRNDDPANPTRVLNLSYGTDGIQDYKLDPLTHAVENAWRAGIVVVVAGGNEGTTAPRLNNPAYDPYVIAVGASDTKGTVGASDDVVPAFSSRGDAARRVDLVAPGRSIVSLRSPGSMIDDAYPAARVGERYFKGSGSSQSAAVVSGAVALLLQARPTLRPDQVKALLRSSATPMPLADAAGRGAGALNVFDAFRMPTPSGSQTWAKSTGLGSLDAARGTQRVADEGVELTGEKHVLGPFNAKTWAPASASFTAWSGGKWAGSEWTSGCYCADTWAGKAWSGKAWSGSTWTGKAWSGKSWSGKSWSGKAWSGDSWTSDGWASTNWLGKAWSGKAWTSTTPPGP